MAPPTDTPRPRRGYFLPGVIALGALIVIGLSVGAGDLEHPAPTTLDGSEIAAQIALGVQAQENASHPPTVTCPAREPVRAGVRFQCHLGRPGPTVYVTEVDGRGRVHWSLTPG
jgi:hypothetical protein